MLMTRGWARAWTIARAAAAVVILIGVFAQASKTFSGAIEKHQDVATVVINFFSFFTVLSNCAACIVLAWAAFWFWTRAKDAAPEPRSLGLALASVSTYMIVTGIVYNVLLRGIALPQGTTVWWSNEILHVVG